MNRLDQLAAQLRAAYLVELTGDRTRGVVLWDSLTDDVRAAWRAVAREAERRLGPAGG